MTTSCTFCAVSQSANRRSSSGLALTLVYQVLNTGQPYRERGRTVLDQRQKERIIRHRIRRLGRLGIRVRTTSAASAKPSRKRCRAAGKE